ncbi:GNAT family N-acetyltransferase [Amycolatopsis sp. A133]|uniref:GNAT family N-acetyltransferase n=1 Tax=Amycolatopsis sp. A133 TaxID=3064472 RepID=UPI0027FCD0E0|nr:GNAT family N-acetyltransferase [Amycolatopsis sp. A133]MDQ7809499.1 GNAT family N-acetyltransferase [Amycolatopsis sp. A133]
MSWAGWKVRLREVRPADHRALIGFDRDSGPQVGGYRHWATHRGAADGSGDDFHFAIETLHNRTLVGSIWIQADPASGRFSYGIGIGPPYRRCGYAADAVTVLLAFMFEVRRYHKCEVSINGSNFASLALHGELGFREEGRPRDTELRRGEIRYPVLMGITADRFAEHQPAFLAARGPVRPWRGRHWRTPRRGRHWRPEHLRPAR